jgi:tripartite-type tricarboxylate transporter receptor subunit TctC
MALIAALPRTALAQVYPAQPVRIVVGFAAGGTPDIIARLMGQWLSQRSGQQFIIENRPGAAGNIAAEVVIRATADGYTLLMVGLSNAVNASLYDKLNFEFIRDIAPVAAIGRVPGVMVVNPSFQPANVSEFIAYAKANPDKINMATSGNGSPQHVYGELFSLMSGVKMLHVPYRGGAPAASDMFAGRVQVMFSPLPETIGHIRGGKLRALAVTTAKRSEVLPDVPALSEFIPGFEASSWYGIGAPKNTPAEIIDKLNNDINAALADPDMKARLTDLGGSLLPGPPSGFRKLLIEETEKWAKVVQSAGIKPD